jgi:DegV family protein with EDD domain
MSRIAIVTDSTAYIPESEMSGLPIFTIPLHVIWGEDSYRDNVDITPYEFYQKLPDSKIMPSTSQPSPQEFIEVYKKVLQDYDEILSIHISSKLSGTVDSALQAKQSLSNEKIEVVDSLTTSMGLGLLVLLAARAAKNGSSLHECKNIAEGAKERVHVYFIVTTLEYLKRGGRIGGASAFLGTAINLKPILMLKDGIVEAHTKIRTLKKALHHLVEIFVEKTQGKTPVHIAIIHSGADEDAKLLKEEIYNHISQSEIAECMIAGISPVLGTHAGPGAIGVCFLTDK